MIMLHNKHNTIINIININILHACIFVQIKQFNLKKYGDISNWY